MGLRDIKIPNFKFKKMKLDENILHELANIDYEKEAKKIKHRNKPYEDMTHYETVREFFLRSIDMYSDRPCILEKKEHKEPYTTISYKEFGEDVIGLTTAMIDLLNLKDKRVIIIGETQYGWYISYMAMLCGVGIAVPTDKELPLNELENIITRSKASAIIYSPKKEEEINKIKEKNLNVEYYIKMKSNDKIEGKDVGLNYLVEVGRKLVENGNKKFYDIKINPDEFKI